MSKCIVPCVRSCTCLVCGLLVNQRFSFDLKFYYVR
uniref:Uncharacterized protein n=1 Tax=Arundo donax TaxID=35708 RepID=A0A0A9E920_ARUDO